MKKLLLRLTSFFPRKLPTGMTSFNAWVSDIIVLSGLPDNDTVRNAAAGFIFQLPPTMARFPVRKIANMLIKAAANQVAQQVLLDAKEKAESERKESKAVSSQVGPGTC